MNCNRPRASANLTISCAGLNGEGRYASRRPSADHIDDPLSGIASCSSASLRPARSITSTACSCLRPRTNETASSSPVGDQLPLTLAASELPGRANSLRADPRRTYLRDIQAGATPIAREHDLLAAQRHDPVVSLRATEVPPRAPRHVEGVDLRVVVDPAVTRNNQPRRALRRSIDKRTAALRAVRCRHEYRERRDAEQRGRGHRTRQRPAAPSGPDKRSPSSHSSSDSRSGVVFLPTRGRGRAASPTARRPPASTRRSCRRCSGCGGRRSWAR